MNNEKTSEQITAEFDAELLAADDGLPATDILGGDDDELGEYDDEHGLDGDDEIGGAK